MKDISELDKYVIEKVKILRQEQNISQQKLSQLIGFSEGFIGNIENPRLHEKYNIKHLNLLAKALNCSPKDFFPDQPL
ncbi:helix-turn-helix domain-containing protein [Mucilaginibacter rubeus]|uniref:helix-turn-helix domain-containing protein n=1 Tax=Mucilaginibacter rubeus TaxID=2027860 RepID=UPI00166EBA0C|nr:helix-turn-helix transcriptional regulator [Mucilaginibacter rubeus]GGA95678.1 transcriptional regulator [Mucilaginibacter rubeus]